MYSQGFKKEIHKDVLPPREREFNSAACHCRIDKRRQMIYVNKQYFAD